MIIAHRPSEPESNRDVMRRMFITQPAITEVRYIYLCDLRESKDDRRGRVENLNGLTFGDLIDSLEEAGSSVISAGFEFDVYHRGNADASRCCDCDEDKDGRICECPPFCLGCDFIDATRAE